jgi:hypothetical protein
MKSWKNSYNNIKTVKPKKTSLNFKDNFSYKK